MENSGVPLPLREILKDFMKELNLSFLSCLYFASRDGFGANNFHAKCDGKNKIIVIIKSKGFYFGGYISSSSNSVRKGFQGNFFHSDYSFIFSFKSSKQIYFFKCVDHEKSIFDSSNCGPIFGYGHDIFIRNKSNQRNDDYTYIEYSRKVKKKEEIIQKSIYGKMVDLPFFHK